eukprot:gene4051-4298_t
MTSSDEEDREQQEITGANADPELLQYFWDLASLEQADRVAAADALVTALVASQKVFDVEHRATDAQPAGSLEQNEGGSRQQRMEQALHCCSPHMAYGLKRLARGLASSRQGARQGFAAALAATLQYSAAAVAATAQASSSNRTPQLQQPFVSAAGVLAVLDACLEVTGAMKGSDQRDTLLGRVFGLAALARSGLVAACPAAAADAAPAAGGSARPAPAALLCMAAVAEQLVALLHRKSFLRECAVAAAVELLQPLTAVEMQQVLAAAPKLSALLQLPASSAPPEALFLALRLWHNLPPHSLQLFWQQPGIVQRQAVAAAAAAVFSAGWMQQLVPVLLASSSSYPRLHPVWGCLMALMIPGFVPIKGAALDHKQQEQQQQQQRAAPEPQQLTNFWQQFVEGACFSSSHERKALAERLKSCTEHNQVVKGNVAAAAKLRMAVAAALQSHPRLQAAAGVSGGSGKVAAQQQLLQGLDAAGVGVYVDQLLGELVAAVNAAAGPRERAGRNGAAAAGGEGDGGSDSDDLQADHEASGTGVMGLGKARLLVDQLVAALRFPAADSSTLCKGLAFLAAVAFLQLPSTVNEAELVRLLTPAASTEAAGSAAVEPDGSSSAAKKSRKKAKVDASADEDDSEGGGGNPAWQDVLLDLIISLLSSSASPSGNEATGSSGGAAAGAAAAAVPSAPLREACEALFRVFAEDMTAQGIADLLRILTQRASEILKPQDDEDDVEEAEQEGEEGITSDDADEDKAAAAADGDGDDSDSDDPEAAPEAEADEQAGSEDEETDQELNDDLDDAAMMRLDAQLGAAVRAMINRGGAGARERAAALLALQLRVAALMEEWLKKCPRSPLVLQVVLPLVKALVAANGPGGNATLADRLAALVNKHLSKCRPAFATAAAAGAAVGNGADTSDDKTGAPSQQQTVTATGSDGVQSLRADLRKVLYLASRDKDPRVAAAAGQGLLVLLSAACKGDSSASALAQETAAAALADVFEKKKSRVQRSWCEQLLIRCPEAIVAGDAAAVQKAGGAGSRMAELLGAETVRELSKAVVVVKAAGVAPRVETQLERLVSVAGLQQMVAASKPDPARLTLLKKSRAALEGKAATIKTGVLAAAQEDQLQQQQQGSAVQRNESQAAGKTKGKLRQQKSDDQGALKRKHQAANPAGNLEAKKGRKSDKDKGQQQEVAVAGVKAGAGAGAGAGAASPALTGKGKRKPGKGDANGLKKQKKHTQQ